MGNRAEKKALREQEKAIYDPAQAYPDVARQGLLSKLRESREEYQTAGNAEMLAYVDDIIKRIESIRRTENRAQQMRVRKRKAAKQARKITRRNQK